MFRKAIAAMFALGLATATPARAQEIYETPVGVNCLEAWITTALMRINGYRGDASYNAAKPYRVNRFGLILGSNAFSNYEPDNWVTYGADRNSYMWRFIHTSEEQYPYWPVDEYNAARVPGLRYFVRQCVAGAGGGGGGGANPSGGGAVSPGVGAGAGPGPGATVSPSALCPPNWSVLAGYPGVVLGCYCPGGAPTGSVWGSDVYTADSGLCAAAVHAGMISAGGGAVWSTIGGARDQFVGMTRNGVTSRDYGPYDATAWFLGAPIGVQTAAPTTGACPGNMQGQPDRLSCYCDPSAIGAGSVWGSGLYTDDSTICRAALHAGVIGTAGGSVNIRVRAGQDSYAGTTFNGVTSSSYGRWGRSYEFLR